MRTLKCDYAKAANAIVRFGNVMTPPTEEFRRVLEARDDKALDALISKADMHISTEQIIQVIADAHYSEV